MYNINNSNPDLECQSLQEFTFVNEMLLLSNYMRPLMPTHSFHTGQGLFTEIAN